MSTGEEETQHFADSTCYRPELITARCRGPSSEVLSTLHCIDFHRVAGAEHFTELGPYMWYTLEEHLTQCHTMGTAPDTNATQHNSW